MTLDTPATLKALARTNDIAKARKLTINALEREARGAGSLQALQAQIERLMQELTIAEKNITG